jgi:hypothetical protein
MHLLSSTNLQVLLRKRAGNVRSANAVFGCCIDAVHSPDAGPESTGLAAHEASGLTCIQQGFMSPLISFVFPGQQPLWRVCRRQRCQGCRYVP